MSKFCIQILAVCIADAQLTWNLVRGIVGNLYIFYPRRSEKWDSSDISEIIF